MFLLEFGLRCILLVLSLYGYIQFLSKKIRVELAVPLLFSSIGAVMFMAGMENMLQEMTLLIWGTGVYLACCSIRKKELPFSLFTPGMVFFLSGCAVLLFVIYGTKLEAYDDFSHWGTAAKVLAQYDRFPNATNTNISFTSYPLGSASFIYYITKILGISSEWLQCYAQAVLMLGMVLSFFAFSSGVCSIITAAGISVFMLASNMPFTCLLVDTLLPLTAIAAFAFCLYYKDELPQKIWFLLPYSIFLISIKNSGILFVVFLYLYIAYRFKKSNTRFFSLLLHILCTLAVLWFWQKHVKMVYADGMMSRHSLSLSYCTAIFTNKTQMDILVTIRCFLERVFSFSNTFILLIAAEVLILLLSDCVLKMDSSFIKQIFVFTFIFYGIYQIGLLGMYLFNMPQDSDPLPSYVRYHDTMIIFAAGLFGICLLLILSQIKDNAKLRILQVLLAVATLIASFYVINPYMVYYKRSVSPGKERQTMDMLIEDYNIESDRDYFILVSDDHQDSGYLMFMMQYLLNPQDLQICSPASMELWLEEHFLKHYDYYILFEQTPETLELFEKYFDTTDRVVCTLE